MSTPRPPGLSPLERVPVCHSTGVSSPILGPEDCGTLNRGGGPGVDHVLGKDVLEVVYRRIIVEPTTVTTRRVVENFGSKGSRSLVSTLGRLRRQLDVSGGNPNPDCRKGREEEVVQVVNGVLAPVLLVGFRSDRLKEVRALSGDVAADASHSTLLQGRKKEDEDPGGVRVHSHRGKYNCTSQGSHLYSGRPQHVIPHGTCPTPNHSGR